MQILRTVGGVDRRGSGVGGVLLMERIADHQPLRRLFFAHFLQPQLHVFGEQLRSHDRQPSLRQVSGRRVGGFWLSRFNTRFRFDGHRHINPADNWMVALPSLGEGWHNYHHAFPSDYRTSELGDYAFNYTTAIIDACHRLGLATDLKTMSRHLVYSRAQRTGDGSHPSSHPRH